MQFCQSGGAAVALRCREGSGQDLKGHEREKKRERKSITFSFLFFFFESRCRSQICPSTRMPLEQSHHKADWPGSSWKSHDANCLRITLNVHVYMWWCFLICVSNFQSDVLQPSCNTKSGSARVVRHHHGPARNLHSALNVKTIGENHWNSTAVTAASWNE